MTIPPETLLALVRCNLMALTLTATGHKLYLLVDNDVLKSLDPGRETAGDVWKRCPCGIVSPGRAPAVSGRRHSCRILRWQVDRLARIFVV